MRKITMLLLTLLAILLTSCGNSEVEIPDDATIATCPQGDTFVYIYKDDVVYEFYSNDELQDASMLKIVQDAVDNVGDARTYLDDTFTAGVCTFTEYSEE
jgi:uncharacterized lipoprotein YehR (DUF1307 family)